MVKVYQNIFVGNESSCNWKSASDWAIIHACKHPCHRNAVGYKNNLPPAHPNYLIHKKDNHLVLNMVDMEQELLPRFADSIMSASMTFMAENIGTKNILIHCNQGISRSPSIALLYLARIGYLPRMSYLHATNDFKIIYPSYSPGTGISTYLRKRWEYLLNF